MDCQAFLSQHSAYRDGTADPELAAPLSAHVARCATCAAYDRALRVGVEALRQGEITPSADFRRSLELRLKEVAAEMLAPSDAER